VHQIIDRLQQLNLANPVMDVHMPCVPRSDSNALTQVVIARAF
jgi:hypothetical protein